MNCQRHVPFPPLQGAFRQSRNRSQGVEHAPRNPLLAPRSPSGGTTSHSTKPASGQVAGYPRGRGVRSGATRIIILEGHGK